MSEEHERKIALHDWIFTVEVERKDAHEARYRTQTVKVSLTGDAPPGEIIDQVSGAALHAARIVIGTLIAVKQEVEQEDD